MKEITINDIKTNPELIGKRICVEECDGLVVIAILENIHTFKVINVISNDDLDPVSTYRTIWDNDKMYLIDETDRRMLLL